MRRRLTVASGTSIVWLLVLLLLTWRGLHQLSAPAWGNPVGSAQLAEVAGGTEVGQTFVAPFPGLHRIEVMLDPSNASGNHAVEFHLSADPSSATDLRVHSVATSELRAGVPVQFDFEPIRDSEGSSYYFYLRSPDSSSGDAVSVLYSPEAQLDGATARLDDEPVQGNLQFSTYYQLQTQEKIDLLLDRMSEGRPYIFGSKAFYVVLAAAFLIILMAFLWTAARLAVEEHG